MTDVVLASLAAATPMGQQEYENQLAAHVPGIRVVHIRSLRSTLEGDRRLPLGFAAGAPLAVQHALARYAFGAARLVHRADLRLPAASCEVVTVHDLAPLRFDDEGTLPPRAADTLRAARAVITPSEFAASELRELFDVIATVIPNGLDPAVWSPPQSLDIAVPARFVLHSGGATRRKNLTALADAWQRLDLPDVELLLCGPPDDRRTSLFADLPRTRLLGRVPRATHLALMHAAAAVVVPSTYEGFGFPALEAMAVGTPVVAANRTSLPEVCGDAALLTEPDADSVAVALRAVLTDDALRERLAAAGPDHARAFTWQASALAHGAVYQRALG